MDNQEWELRVGRCQDILGDYAGQAQLVITSPPYDDLRSYDGHMDAWDFDEVADAIVPVLRDGGVLVWIVADAVRNGSETGTSFRHALGFLDRGLNLHQTLIYRRWAINGMANDRYYREHEYMFVFANGRPGVANMLTDRVARDPGRRSLRRGAGRQSSDRTTGRWRMGERSPAQTKRGTVWEYHAAMRAGQPTAEGRQPYRHPAIFPYPVAVDHILTWTNPGDLVVDPMMGSGTSVRAARNLGRRALGIDVNPAYAEIAGDRMAQMTFADGTEWEC